MVRNILIGLLLAGVTPTIVADASVMESKQKTFLERQPQSRSVDAVKSCTVLKSSAICDASLDQNTDINSGFRIQNIAQLLLSRSMFPECLRRSPNNQWYSSEFLLQPQASKNAPTTKTFRTHSFEKSFKKSKCIFSWRNQFNRKFENKTLPKSTSSLPDSIAQSSVAPTSSSKFPKLSRSSLIVSLPQQDSSFAPATTQLANPAPATKRIASPFGWRRRPYSNQLQFHQGIDYGAPLGSPVVAVGNGIVTRVTSGCADFGNLFCGGQLGNWIEIDHGNGAIATYGHLKNSSITIEQGMKVWKNQEIAQVGSSGWSTGAHLDFRMKVNGEYEDPAKYVMAIDTAKSK